MSIVQPEPPSPRPSLKSFVRFILCLEQERIPLWITMERKTPLHIGVEEDGVIARESCPDPSTDLLELFGGILEGRLSYCGPLPAKCTRFQKSVLEETRKIPYGEVRSYKEIAKKTGNPGASRAVGQALAQNPLPLLIPCHRVMGANGRLTGYSMGGTAIKQALLGAEQEKRVP